MELLKIIQGEVCSGLATVEKGSVQTVITSPPYYGLRSYLPPDHPDKALEIGSESTPEHYINKLTRMSEFVKDCLKPDGIFWLNLGDSYAAQRSGTAMPAETIAGGVSGKGDEDAHRGRSLGDRQAESTGDRNIAPHRNARAIGLKHKDLLMIPARVAIALQAHGWFLRAMIPWIKRNPIPESVEDRPSVAIEYVFMLTKDDDYYYDKSAVEMPYAASTLREAQEGYRGESAKEYEDAFAQDASETKRRIIQSIREKNAHIRTNPDRRETDFDGRWRSQIADQVVGGRNRRNSDWFWESFQGMLGDADEDPLALIVNTHGFKGAHFATFPERLVWPMIKASTKEGDIVMDPFFGSGTVGVAALKLNRRAIGIELNPEFVEIAKARCAPQMSGHLL